MNARLRVGRKVGRTLYLQVGDDPSDDDQLVGVMDTRELATYVASMAAVLRLIEVNARSFHKGEDGKERALAVIADWAAEGSELHVRYMAPNKGEDGCRREAAVPAGINPSGPSPAESGKPGSEARGPGLGQPPGALPSLARSPSTTERGEAA